LAHGRWWRLWGNLVSKIKGEGSAEGESNPNRHSNRGDGEEGRILFGKGERWTSPFKRVGGKKEGSGPEKKNGE